MDLIHVQPQGQVMRPVQAHPALPRGLLQHIQHMMDIQDDVLPAALPSVSIPEGRREKQNPNSRTDTQNLADMFFIPWIVANKEIIPG